MEQKQLCLAERSYPIDYLSSERDVDTDYMDVSTIVRRCRLRICFALQTPFSIVQRTISRPFVTGRSFGKRDDQSLHNDGAFAGLLRGLTLTLADENHHSLRLPWNFDLLWNGLNMLLGHDRALQFWNEGLKRGID